MTPALYFSTGGKAQSEFYHYGLAAPIYTHFTSPIRRFADVIVHRLLAASIGAAPLPTTLNHRNIQKTCENINRRHRMADIAGRDSTRLHTILFFKEKTLTENGRVINVRANGFTVLIPRYGIEGKVYLTQSTSDTSKLWDYSAKTRTIVSPDKKYTIRVFDTVKIQITLDNTREHAPRVVFKCLEPPIHTIKPDVPASITTISKGANITQKNIDKLSKGADPKDKKTKKRKKKGKESVPKKQKL